MSGSKHKALAYIKNELENNKDAEHTIMFIEYGYDKEVPTASGTRAVTLAKKLGWCGSSLELKRPKPNKRKSKLLKRTRGHGG